MTKAIKQDGKVFRIRRGKLVQIPEQWVGKFPTEATKRERPSKHIHKLRKYVKYGHYNDKAKKVDEAIQKDDRVALALP